MPSAAWPLPTRDGMEQHNPRERTHGARAQQQAARGEPTQLLLQSTNGLPHHPYLFSHRSKLSCNVPEFSRA